MTGKPRAIDRASPDTTSSIWRWSADHVQPHITVTEEGSAVKLEVVPRLRAQNC
jgi:hypothetical protein